MKSTNSAWLRLAKAARQGSRSENESAPFGFSTRVAALAANGMNSRPSLLTTAGLFSWRALGLALTLMFLSIAANYSALASSGETEPEAVLDPIGEILTSS